MKRKIRKKPKSHVKTEHVLVSQVSKQRRSEVTRARHGGRILSALTQFQSMKDIRLPLFCIWKKYKYFC